MRKSMIEARSLEDIALLKESEELECKKAAGRDGKGELPNDFWETYSAMANTNGGVVLLGVKETKDGFQLHNLEKIELIKKQIVDIANNHQKVSTNLISNNSFKEINIDGKNILQVVIPRAQRGQRPVFLNKTPFGNTYRRIHEVDQVVDDNTVKRMLADQVDDSLDDKLLKGYYLDSLNKDTLKAYRQVFANRSPESPWNSLGDIPFLQRIGAWKIDRESEEQGLTLAGLLMFGEYPAIQEVLPFYTLDYRESDSDIEKRWIDRITLDATWSGNLYDFYKKVFKKLTEDIKIPFTTQSSERIDETPQHIAIREALCNVLVHADYNDRASVLIIKRPEMYGFRNPGLMRVSIDIALSGGETDCRNRRLHQMFRYVGIGEQAGSGIPKILQTWKQYHWRTPSLYEKVEPYDQTLLELRKIDLFPHNTMKELKHFLGDQFEQIGYMGQVAIAIAATEGTVSHDRLKLNIDAHSADISKKLHELTELGILEKTGVNKGAVYHLVGFTLPTPEDVFGAPSVIKDDSSPILDDSSPILDDSSPILDDSSPILDDSSPILDGGSHDKQRDEQGCLISKYDDHKKSFIDNLDDISNDLKERLYQISSEPRLKGRLPKERMEQIIIDICQEHYVTIGVLSELLNRKNETLRSSFLSRMVKEGKLSLAFPTKPNDPRQAYTSLTL